jgi:acyl dehydratase
MKFFEDIALGDTAAIGRHTFTADEIKAFAAQYDPQPFHLDEAAAARSHFGGLCASGWHVTCVWMRLMIDYRRREDAARRAQDKPVAALGVSPGFRDLEWPTPVYPGDTISYDQKAIDKRTSLTRPQWGILTAHNTGVNQRGELVLSFVSSAFIERRAQAKQTPQP